MEEQQQFRWPAIVRLTPVYAWIAGGTVLLFALILIGYQYKITLWDWAQMLFIPAVIAAGGLWFTRQQQDHELRFEVLQRQRELNLAEQNALDEAFQAYLDQMGNLLLDKDRPLRKWKEGTEVRTLAQGRTLTVLTRLDGMRKRSVLHVVYEVGLINKDRPIISLNGANLSRVSFLDIKRSRLS